MKYRHAFVAALLALAAIAAPASAQRLADTDRVDEVRISVMEPGSHNELTNLAPGEQLTMAAGGTVLLRIFEPASGGDDRDYLPGRWSFQAGRDRLRMDHLEVDRGAVTITALPARNPGDLRQRISLRYELDPAVEVGHPRLRQGTIDIEIRDDAGPTPVPPPITTSGWADRLYRGILLREPDAGGAANVEERILRDGYRGLVEAAREIAASRESQIGVYERGNNQQRLLALYRHLLDRDQNAIPLDTWRRQLARLESGDVEAVVTEIVRSDEFLRQWDLEDTRLVRPRQPR